MPGPDVCTATGGSYLVFGTIEATLQKADEYDNYVSLVNTSLDVTVYNCATGKFEKPTNHHGRGMDPVLAPETFQPERHVDDLFGVGVGLVHATEVGGGGVTLFMTFGLVRQACSGVSRPITSGGIALAMRSPTM